MLTPMGSADRAAIPASPTAACRRDPTSPSRSSSAPGITTPNSSPPSRHPQLGPEGIPSIAEARIDVRLRAPDGGDRGLDVWSCLTREVFDLVNVETRGVGEPEACPLLQPECACVETQGRKGLHQRYF